MRKVKRFFGDGSGVILFWALTFLIALLIFEQISPSPKKVGSEALTEMSREKNEVVEVKSAVPEEELVLGGDDLSQEVLRREEEGYYEALELLARVIHCENSSEIDGEEACWYTGSVIINRINSGEFPNTLEGVIYEKNQYDCLKSLYKENPTDIEYEVAAELLNSGSILPEDVLYAAEFTQAKGVYDKIGNTYYCY